MFQDAADDCPCGAADVVASEHTCAKQLREAQDDIVAAS
jgi:hypothetical protein